MLVFFLDFVVSDCPVLCVADLHEPGQRWRTHCRLATGSDGLTWCLFCKHGVWHKSVTAA